MRMKVKMNNEKLPLFRFHKDVNLIFQIIAFESTYIEHSKRKFTKLAADNNYCPIPYFVPHCPSGIGTCRSNLKYFSTLHYLDPRVSTTYKFVVEKPSSLFCSNFRTSLRIKGQTSIDFKEFPSIRSNLKRLQLCMPYFIVPVHQTLVSLESNQELNLQFLN